MRTIKKLLSVIMVAAIAVTFSPVVNGQAFAAAKKPAIPKSVTAKEHTDSTDAEKLIDVKWKKAKNAKKYQVAMRSAKKKWIKDKTVKKTKANKKKYTKKNKYKVVAKGKKYIVYKYAYKFSILQETTGRFVRVNQTPTWDDLKPNTKYTFAVRSVNGKKYRTINGVSLGLDGFCCEEKDRLSALGIDRSYVLIALQALVYKYHTTNARVTVDGVTKTYDRVWIAPTMFGSYYGGGVLIAPSQKRDNPEHLVTCQILHGCSRFIGTTIFLAVTKGHSDRFPKFVDIRPGRHVVVEFDRPAALQIDGEVISGVTRYEVDAGL